MSIQSILKSTLVSFLLMFILTYVAIDNWGHFYININKFYMAGVMSSPMLIIKALSMREMLEKNIFLSIVSSGAVLTVLFFLAIRVQLGVGNDQFLRSMIPHHSSAIIMCERSQITDPEIISLCEDIVKTQKEEIAKMKNLLGEN